jgi:ubiquinone/menaquinone biosynthesis C-methylase UbiE
MNRRREPSTAQTVSERYSSDAAAYRDLWAPILLPHGRELLDALPLAWAARVLDVGSGCGTLLAELRCRAPSATVVAIDRAGGMLALAPQDVPRAAMDAARLGLVSGSIDVEVLAFILFHTVDPLDVLLEARRVLRSGGSVGATTWDGDPRFPAQQAWLEELDAHGALPAAPPLANHEPVKSPALMRGLLERAGFTSVRTWTRPFAQRYTLDQFLEVRTRLGWSKRRLESLSPGRRQAFLRSVRRRLETMGPRDFLDDAAIIFSTAAAP